MKIPLKWLADYVDLSVSPAELSHRLTLAGLEVASVRCFGVPHPEGLRVKCEEVGPVWERDKIVIGKILEIQKHPNADLLKLPVVEYGEGRQQRLVTGAPNINVGESGHKVIIGLRGSQYWMADKKDPSKPKQLVTLQPKELRGIPNDAMCMSNFELGINDEHEGIILLDDPEVPVGTPLADYLGDIVLEVDVLPNMARCLSLIGIAREVAALTGKRVKLPETAPKAEGKPIKDRVKVAIADPKLSARYAAGLIEGVKIGPAPAWMQYRLTYAGMRPINNIVDITNYVMLEFGQPLHAFDHDLLVKRAGGKAPLITVRPATDGEILKTLDGVERKLNPDMLVIADEKGAIALAGVMGGAETEVSATTTSILLESANFDFVSIRKTSRALDLPSEASARFSRGIHPEMVLPALGRAGDLMRQYAGGKVAAGVVDVYPSPLPPRVVELKLAEVHRLLGFDIPLDECARVLQALEFGVEKTKDGLKATVPAHRLDIQEGPADLIEDLARLHGYDRLPATLLRDQLPEQHNNEPLLFEEKVRDRLIACSLQEVITYSLTTPEKEAPLGLEKREYVRLLNPISSERVVMRHSILAGVLDVAESNLRHEADVRLFEIGSVYLPQEGKKLPEEPRWLSVVLSGRRSEEFWQGAGQQVPQMLDFFDVKGVIESLLADLHIPGVTYRPLKPAHLHPGKAAAVVVNEKVLGTFGELHPRVAESYKLAGKVILVADLDLEALRSVVPPRHPYSPVLTMPQALRDVAVIVEQHVPAERVAAEIRAAGGDLLREVRLFDLYQGESIPQGTRSLAYALTYQATDRTLTDKEIEKAHKKVEDRLRHVLKARIRGQDA